MSFKPRPDCQIPCLEEIYQAHLPPHGRFVEVGAFDGITVSNTVMLAESGWAGLYVEAHPSFAHECQKNHAGRLGIQVVNTAVSDHEGEANLWVIGECSTLVWDQNAIDWGGNVDNKIKVPTTTLDALLLKHKWEPRFELLVIDVEQHELAVLRGFNLRHWLPKMVIIEAHEKDKVFFRNFKAQPITEFFEKVSYRKIYADHINTIFLR